MTPVLVRDQVTWAGYATLSTWGWFLYAWGGILPLLRAEQGTSRTVMGLHGFVMSLGAIVAGLLTVRIVARVRRRGAVRLGLTLVVAGIGVLCLAGPPLLTLPAILVAGTGGSIVLNAANPGMSDHHGDASATVLAEGNAVAAGVGILAPAAVGAGVALGLTWRPAALVVVPLALLSWLLLRRVPTDTAALDSAPALRPAGADGSLGLRFWLLATALVTGVGIEFANTAWAADLLAVRTGMGPATASAGVTAIVVGLTVGRLVAGRLALRIAPRLLLLAAMGLTFAGWLLLWTTTSPLVAVAGLVVVGLGISGHYPLGVSLVYAAAGTQGDRATGIISLGIGAFAATTPFVLGAVADATSTHTAFLVVPVLVIAVVGFLVAAGPGPAPDPEPAPPSR
ncbi:MAG: MFS transporter [Kineosporiaceae bacterium]